jgi:hypothetical protein
MLPTGLCLRKNLALLALGLLMVAGPFCCFQFPPNCDVMQFYGAGDMINRGEAHRLYDQKRFQELQLPISDGVDCSHHYSLYPPTVGLVLAPWAKLPFSSAKLVWFGAEVLLYAVFAGLVWKCLDIPQSRRLSSLLAMASPISIWLSLHIGQLTPVWMLALMCGMLLMRGKRSLSAGLVLSVLAMKPQLMVMPFLWLIFRRDRRAMAALLAGCAVQFMAVVLVLGADMPFYFLRELPGISQAAKTVDYTACFEQSIAGSLKTTLVEHRWLSPENRWLAIFLQIVPFVLAAGLLWQVVDRVRARFASGTSSAFDEHYEYACLGLATLLSTPHLLMYDATLVLVPIAFLLATPAWPWGAALLASETTVAAVLYLLLDMCLMPVIAFWALYRIALGLGGKQRAGAA